MSSRSTLYFVSVRIGVIMREHRAHELAGQAAVRSISRSTSSASRLRVQRLMKPWSVVGVVAIGVEIDRRDGQHEVLDLVRVQRGVAGREHAALADAEQRDLVVPGLAADALHAAWM